MQFLLLLEALWKIQPFHFAPCLFFFFLSSSLAVFIKLMGNPALIISRIFQSDCGGVKFLSAAQLPRGRGRLADEKQRFRTSIERQRKWQGLSGHRAWMYKLMGTRASLVHWWLLAQSLLRSVIEGKKTRINFLCFTTNTL